MDNNKNSNSSMGNILHDEKRNIALNWMFNIDGCKRDIRKEPREFQEQAYFSGMIPFIPADYPRQGKVKEKFENNIRIVEYRSDKNTNTAPEHVSE